MGQKPTRAHKATVILNMNGGEYRFEGCWIDQTRIYPSTLGGLNLKFEYDVLIHTDASGRVTREDYSKQHEQVEEPEPTRPRPKAQAHASSEPAAAWWSSILESPTTLKEAERAYKRQSLKRHPDGGGSHEAMVELNQAIEEARKWFR